MDKQLLIARLKEMKADFNENMPDAELNLIFHKCLNNVDFARERVRIKRQLKKLNINYDPDDTSANLKSKLEYKQQSLFKCT